MRIEHGHHGWWATALRHQVWHAGHRHAPEDDAVRESAASKQRVICDTGATGCEWCDRTEARPERLDYARYLERQNTEAIEPRRRPAPAGADTPAEGPDRGWADLGDVPRRLTFIEQRVQTAYQVRLITAQGRYLDVWM